MSKTLTRRNLQRIHELACSKWKTKLQDMFPALSIHDEMVIKESVYRSMREACTSEQHKLFNEIFGNGNICKPNDWVKIVWDYNKDIDVFKVLTISDDGVLSVPGTFSRKDKDGKIENIPTGKTSLFCYYDDRRTMEVITEEEAVTIMWEKDKPYLIRGINNGGWRLRYSSEKINTFYCDGKKTGMLFTELKHRRLNIDNLPVVS